MKKKLLAAFLSSVMILGAAAGCSQGSQSASAAGGESGSSAGAASSQAAGEKNHKVILITMDSIDQHWVSVDKGCKKAVAELNNVDYKWLAPDKKDDAQQIERVNTAIADNADAILIAANGPDAITSALEDAKSKGIKIIYVDSAAKTEGEATFATNNEAAGKQAGEQMLEALQKAGKTSGKIGVVNVNSATASTVAREKGFRSAFDGKGYELLATQYSEGDAAKSQDIADNYITQGAVGLFGANEGCTVGVGNAIKGSGKSDLVGVGFDKSDSIYSLIKDGSLLCTMAQNPEVMGYEGMKAAVAVLSGQTIENKDVDTGVSVLTKDKIS
ncbi:substrate-binding domain-containing protein [Caproicibacter sp.]|uniref:substrate-binding domain-containing protein n=1 Tax=Caproicibacter sp. TaxID=2814884 RepID=UPI003988F7D8